jgi:hypothetical protein
MYCTISRVGTTEAFLGVASAHLLFFFGTLYLWPDLLAAGLTARMLGYRFALTVCRCPRFHGVLVTVCAVSHSLTFHGLVSLLTLSSASTGGKVAGAKSHMYGFTLLLCTVHFGIFLWMLACPQCFAEDVLNYKTVTVSSAALFANIRLERLGKLWGAVCPLSGLTLFCCPPASFMLPFHPYCARMRASAVVPLLSAWLRHPRCLLPGRWPIAVCSAVTRTLHLPQCLLLVAHANASSPRWVLCT